MQQPPGSMCECRLYLVLVSGWELGTCFLLCFVKQFWRKEVSKLCLQPRGGFLPTFAFPWLNGVVGRGLEKGHMAGCYGQGL